MDHKAYHQIQAEPASPTQHATVSSRATVETPLLSPVATSSSSDVSSSSASSSSSLHSNGHSSSSNHGNGTLPSSVSSSSITIAPDLRRVNHLMYERMDAKDGKEGKRGGGGPPKRPPGQQGLSMSRLLAQAKPERCILAWATLFLFLGAILSLATPAFVGAIIDAISASAADKTTVDTWVAKLGFGDSPDTILTVSVVGLAIAVSCSSFFSMLRGYLYSLAGERVVARLRRQLFASIMRLEIGFFDMTRTGELINRLSSDTTILKEAVTVNISMGLRWASTVIGGIAYLFVISWKLTLVMLSVIPLVAFSARSYGQKIKKLSAETQDALARATETAEESISQIRTVRSFYREPFQMELYNKRIDHTYELGAKIAWLYGAFIGFIGMIASGAMIVVLWYGATLVLKHEMSPGVLTSFVLYTLTVGFALGGLTGLFGTLMKAVGANDRVFEIMDKVPTINIDGGISREQLLTGHVKFEDVSFTYPSRPNVRVLNHFNLELKPGTVTALVGTSGGGKSTVVSLIERFYDAEEGQILLDGTDITKLDPSWVHRQIGLVSQEPVLFATSIRENLTYGVEHATDAQIREACRIANAADFIDSFPEGYDTIVGERGVRLSGGQKQRVAIARAVLMNPVILIADEATSSLDAESEHHVQEALDRLMKGRTVLVVAHRLSTVVNADQVVVIKAGEVVERGRHAELLAASGAYAQLVRRQLQEAPSSIATLAAGVLTNGAASTSSASSTAPLASSSNGSVRVVVHHD